MSNGNSFVNAILPTPYRVLGLELKPFSLGHYFILRRHGCVFVEPGSALAAREDLIFACLVCSMPYEQFNEWQNGAALSPREKFEAFSQLLLGKLSILEFLAALKRTKLEFFLLQWGRKVGFFDLKEKAELFKSYLDEHQRQPQYWIEREPKRASGTDRGQAILSVLTGECGFSKQEALNMPMVEALWHFYSYLETQGIVSLKTPEEIAAEEKEEPACGS